MVSGIHWRSWNISHMDKKGSLKSERNFFFFYGPKEVSNCSVNLSLSDKRICQENSLSLSKVFLLHEKYSAFLVFLLYLGLFFLWVILSTPLILVLPQ